MNLSTNTILLLLKQKPSFHLKDRGHKIETVDFTEGFATNCSTHLLIIDKDFKLNGLNSIILSDHKLKKLEKFTEHDVQSTFKAGKPIRFVDK